MPQIAWRTSFLVTVLVTIELFTSSKALSAEFLTIGSPFQLEYAPDVLLTISDDGKNIVGSIEEAGTSATIELLHWTEQDDLKSFNDRYGFNSNEWTNITRDGSTIVAQNSGKVLLIDVESGSITSLVNDSPQWEPYFSWQNASRAGSIVTGTTRDSTTFDSSALVWRESMWVPMTGDLPDDRSLRASLTRSISEQTNAVVVGKGVVLDSDGTYVGTSGFRWSVADGVEILPGVYGDETTGTATDVTADGQIAVGYSGRGVGFLNRYSIRWDAEANASPLLTSNAQWGSAATRVSDDGNIVVGVIYPSDEGTAGGRFESFPGIWTEATEFVPLQDVLIEDYGLGDALDGWNLWRVSDISGDFRYLTGVAENPDGDYQIFRIDLGDSLPGDFNHDNVLTIEDVDLLSDQIRLQASSVTFDVNDDGHVDSLDLNVWVHDLKQTWLGDVNLDGEFNSSDLVDVFEAGKYELGTASTWSTGDWNADGEFGSGDLVAAFQDGGYEQGPRAAVRAVPEPTSLVTLLTALVTGLFANWGRRIQRLRCRRTHEVTPLSLEAVTKHGFAS